MKKQNPIEEVYRRRGKSTKLKVIGANSISNEDITNAWFYLDDEISLKQFYNLSVNEKQEYVNSLYKIKFNMLTTQQEYILNYFGDSKKINKKNKFITLDPEPVKIGEPSSLNEIPSVDQLVQVDKLELKIYLDKYFELDYQDWESSVRFNTIEKFISNTNNFMSLDEQTINFLKAYKILVSK